MRVRDPHLLLTEAGGKIEELLAERNFSARKYARRQPMSTIYKC